MVGGGLQVVGEPSIARAVRPDGKRGGTGGAFGRAAAAAGVPDASPYTLRHSFCSLLLHEGRSVIYVARQIGHDAKLTLGTYGHVIDELEDAPRVAAEEAIRAACESRGVGGRDDAAPRCSRASENPLFAAGFCEKPSAGLEPATPSLPWRIKPVESVRFTGIFDPSPSQNFAHFAVFWLVRVPLVFLDSSGPARAAPAWIRGRTSPKRSSRPRRR